jgi:hypothetical protein
VSAPDNIAFHAADPAGGNGCVVLLFRPDAEGRVRVREWSSANYIEPGKEDVMPVDEMRARVHAWARAGWALTESPVRIGHWLSGRG